MPIRITVLMLALLPLGAACTQREPVASPPPRPRGIIVDQAVRSPAVVTQSPPTLPARDEPLIEITTNEAPGTTTADQAAPDPEQKEPRNLQTELESMMGSPVTCLKPRPASQALNSVSISLRASVMPSGAVGRGEVSAPGLEPEEVSCVRSRLESLRFAQPIENAPLTVNGSITLNRGS